MKGYITCECGNELCIPTHPKSIYDVCVHTIDVMSFTFQCPECSKHITAHIAYNIIERVIE